MLEEKGFRQSVSRRGNCLHNVVMQSFDSMEHFIVDNIMPNEQRMTSNSELKRAVDHVASCEKQLMEQPEETEQTVLTKFVWSQHEINRITAIENFILSFRLGVRLMTECEVNNKWKSADRLAMA